MICKVLYISHQLFKGKQSIHWNEVEQYLKQYIGKLAVVYEYGDKIEISGDFPDEFAFSNYTKSLRGGLSKTKANASQVIIDLIKSATNRRFVENKDTKHSKDAEKGWYRYDVSFCVAVQGEEEHDMRWNCYNGTLIVRINKKGLFLYDLINIKKEARRPLEPK